MVQEKKIDRLVEDLITAHVFIYKLSYLVVVRTRSVVV